MTALSKTSGNDSKNLGQRKETELEKMKVRTWKRARELFKDFCSLHFPSQSLMTVLAVTALFFLPPADKAHALYSELHSLMSYEASSITGVPSELHVYAGQPEYCLNVSQPTICRGAYDEDADRDPRLTPGINAWWGLLNWGTHFWDPAGGPHAGRLNYVDGIPVNVEKKNAYERAWDLYRLALSEYTEDPETAYHTLGRIVHLLTDMATPAHVHLDPHISPDFEGDDSLEEYTALRYLQPTSEAGKTAFEIDFPLQDLRAVDYNNLSDGGYPDSPTLYRIFFSLAQSSRQYDSDDAAGQRDSGSRRGRSVPLSHDGEFTASVFGPGFEAPLSPEFFRTSASRRLFILPEYIFDNIGGADQSIGVRLDFPTGTESHFAADFVRTDIGDADVQEITSDLFPSALGHVAALYELFWGDTHPSLQKEEVPVLTLEGGSRSLAVSRPAPLEVKLDLDARGWGDADAEVFAWADILAQDGIIRAYFDGSDWKSFSGLNEILPMGTFRLVPIKAAPWVILADTSSLTPASLVLNICIDRNTDRRYSPESSVCQSIAVRVE